MLRGISGNAPKKFTMDRKIHHEKDRTSVDPSLSGNGVQYCGVVVQYCGVVIQYCGVVLWSITVVLCCCPVLLCCCVVFQYSGVH